MELSCTLSWTSLSLGDLIAYPEYSLSSMGSVDLPAVSLINRVQLPYLYRERLAYFFCLVVILKDTVWKTGN